MLRKADALTVALALSIALAACGSSGSTGSSSASAHNEVSFAACMRTHGVPDFPDSMRGGVQIQQSRNGDANVSVGGRTLAVSAPSFQKAMSACQKDAPQGAPISGVQLAKIRVSALAMARCMRAHGVPNFPDPVVSTGPGGHGVGIRLGLGADDAGGQINPNSPAFKTAERICMPLIANNDTLRTGG